MRSFDRRWLITRAPAALVVPPLLAGADAHAAPPAHERTDAKIEAPRGTFGFTKLVYEQVANGKEVTLTEATMDEAKRAWEVYYRSEGGRKDIVRAVHRMLHDLDAEGKNIFLTLKDECTKAGIDFNVLFLAIVESRYRPEVVSHAGARGHFQWVTETARHPRYGLITKNEDGTETDHRTDPLRAGRAMITYLRFFADTFFGGSTNKESVRLALLAYNGSFPHTYALEAKRTNTSVAGYMQFMQQSARTVCAQLNAPKTYVVKPGDTLDAIARRHGVPVASLTRESGKTGVLGIGERITVPPVSERVASVRPAGPPMHIVKRGDTLTKIAARRRLSIEQIIAYNTDKKLTVHTVLRPGDAIRIGDEVQGGDVQESEQAVALRKAQRTMKALSHHVENMDYLAKVEALITVLHDPTYIQHPSLAR